MPTRGQRGHASKGWQGGRKPGCRNRLRPPGTRVCGLAALQYVRERRWLPRSCTRLTVGPTTSQELLLAHARVREHGATQVSRADGRKRRCAPLVARIGVGVVSPAACRIGVGSSLGSQLRSTLMARRRASRDADCCSLNESGMWGARDWLRRLTPRVSAGANEGSGLAPASRLWLTPSFSRRLC